MAATPEGRVKEAVKKLLTSIGAYFYMPMSNGMGRVGAPDFIVCHKGMFYGIETKAPGKIKDVKPNQQRELSAIQAAQGVSIVIDDVSQLSGVFG